MKFNKKKLNEAIDNQMSIEDAIDMIQEAMDLVYDARNMVRKALKSSSASSLFPHYSAYGEYGFAQLMGQGNPYDGSLPKLIDEMQNLDDEDEDYDEDDTNGDVYI